MPKNKKTTTKSKRKKTAPLTEAAVLSAEKKLKTLKTIKIIPIKKIKEGKKRLTVKHAKLNRPTGVFKKLNNKQIKNYLPLRKINACQNALPTDKPVPQKIAKIIKIRKSSKHNLSSHLIDLRNKTESYPANSQAQKRQKNIKRQKLPLVGRAKNLLSSSFKGGFASLSRPNKSPLKKYSAKKYSAINSPAWLTKKIKGAGSELFIVNLLQLLGKLTSLLAQILIKLGENFYNFLIKLANALFVPLKITGAKKIYKHLDASIHQFLKNCGAVLKNIKKFPLLWRQKPPAGWYKKLAVFFIVSVMLVLPLRALLYYEVLQDKKEEILSAGSLAARELNKAGETLLENPDEANLRFRAAMENFQKAEKQLKDINQIAIKLAQIIPGAGKQIKNGQNLLTVGKNIALAGEILSDGFVPLADSPSTHLTKKISILEQNTKKILPLLKEADSLLRKIDDTQIPEDYRQQLNLIKTQLPLVLNNAENFINFSSIIKEILGDNSDKRYLVFFQNNAELRPTGGFLGSFALLDISRGEIKNLEIPDGGTYDMNGGLREKILSPEPLYLVNSRWQLQDANWFADFPTSARKIIWFYEHSGGPTVDGVITLTPEVVERFLAITGPLNLQEKYGVTIDQNNFWPIVQNEAEKKYNETRQSKKIIGQMAPLLIANILDTPRDKFLEILNVLNQLLTEKHILLYFQNNQLQKTALEFGWGGEIKQTTKDYLAVIDTNISGGKSDKKINTTITHEAEIQANGSIIDTVIIKKIHQGERGEPFVGVKNTDYLRVYVPAGSTLLEAKGFLKPPRQLFETPANELVPDPDLAAIEGNSWVDEKTGVTINREFGKTVFAHWLEVEPGSTTVASLKYQLPFSLKKTNADKSFWRALWQYPQEQTYSLFVQKQPGTNHVLISQIRLAKQQQALWQYPQELTAKNKGNVWQLKSELVTDKFLGLVIKNN